MQQRLRLICVTFLVFGLFSHYASTATEAQSLVEPKFEQLPGYKNYQKISRMGSELAGGGRVTKLRWSDDGASIAFTNNSERRQLNFSDLSIGKPSQTDAEQVTPDSRRRGRPTAGRAQQRTSELSPDGKWTANFVDNNVVLKANEGGEKIQITDEGDDRHRYGTCCWVYGEELFQSDAMWWSPDSRKLVYYEIDETGMKDYYLTLDNSDLYTKIQSVRYPKAGDDNPKVSLWVYDLDTKEKKKLEFDGPETQYLFNLKFAPGSNNLLVSRTNRLQTKLDILLVDVGTGSVRTVVSEVQDTWQNNLPLMRFLEDGNRFIWETERTGWKQFELRELDGNLLNPLTDSEAAYPCEDIVEIDEKSGWFYYTAYSDANPYNQQLHRVKLDGSGKARITSSPLNHTSFEIAPNDNWVVAVREQADTPPSTAVYRCVPGEEPAEVSVLATGDRTTAEALNLPAPEIFSFLADDGQTTIYGTLHKPAHFNPEKKYPLLIDVYGGPQSRGINNRYQAANPICELGFLVAKIGNRGTMGRGKAFESANYRKLGGPDMQDQADGARFLAQRPYVDAARIGIFGHSYGGYLSALAVLKHSDIFSVAVAGSPVSDWKNYDTIYTERYMQTPQENAEGYQDGSCMKFADNLKGNLLLVHGLIDDNVHPSNTWQLARKLQDADKRFDMMIYPGFKHGIGSTYNAIRWEYFYKHLRPEPSGDFDNQIN